MKRRLPSLDKRHKKHRPLSPEEALIWQAEMEGKQTTSVPVIKAESPPAPRHEKIKSLPLLIKAPDKGRAKKSSPDATLDLHGHTQDAAYRALTGFIARAYADGLRRVLVITGKGRAGGGILRELVPRWLLESPLREHIMAYDTAAPRQGGMGAWVVRIRKKNDER